MSGIVSNLENLIVKYSECYYRGNPLISDEEFDSMVDELKSINPNSSILSAVGWGYDPSKYGQVVEHLVDCVGISDKRRVSKDYILDDISDSIITPKLDGASVELVYLDGVLSKAITRGNGYKGFDVTSKLKPIVPLLIDISGKVSIVGEYLADTSKFDKDSPIRNIASGFLNRKEYTVEECRDYIFIPYKLRVGDSGEYAYNKLSTIEKLSNLGFPSIPHLKILDGFDFISYEDSLSSLESKFLESHGKNYLVDGIVVTRIDNSQEFCYKTDNESAIVKVIDIEYNMSKNGRITPVVIYEPIILGRAKLSRATAHNIKNLLDYSIGVGSKIEIIRSGEVIPYISKVIESTEPEVPELCPYCGSTLKFLGANLRCVNDNCSYQNYWKLVDFLIYFAPKGLSYKNICKFLDSTSISDIPTLFKYYEYEISSKCVLTDKYAELLDKTLDTIFSEPMRLSDFIKASSINSVGWSSSKKLEELAINLNTRDISLIIDNSKDCINIDAYNNLVSNRESLVNSSCYFNIITCNESIVNDSDNSNNNKLKICITGKLGDNMSKSDFYSKYSDFIEESSLSKCDYLVSDNSESKSSKITKAKNSNISIITSEDLVKNFLV